MSNKTATIAMSLAYTGGGGNSVTEPSKSILAPYLAQEPSQILDVPSGATAGNTYAIAFGGVGVEATAFRVDNNCSCPITIRCNGATQGGLPVPAGGVALMAGPTSATGATGGVLTSLSCVLGGTQGWVGGTQTVLPGSISAWVFGDPG